MSRILTLILFLNLLSPLMADPTNAEKRAAFLKSHSSKSVTPTHHKKKSHTTSSTLSHRKHTTSRHQTNTSHHLVSPSSDTSHDIVIPIDASKKQPPSSAAITIEKSGLLQTEGLQPLPTPIPHTTRGWWIFSHEESQNYAYRYLTPSLRHAIDHAPVRRGRWKYIVVHNSGSRVGNAHIFDVYHRRVRHMVNGLAYHFVIGNGHGSGNGQIEVGHRWIAQLNGGHVASDYLNDIALGICLVGDYNRDVPTKEQLTALNELTTYLRYRVGNTQGHPSVVKAHKEINPRPTDCPGRYFPYRWLHREFDR